MNFSEERTLVLKRQKKLGETRAVDMNHQEVWLVTTALFEVWRRLQTTVRGVQTP